MQAARVAAQLREAARDMERLAARRAQAETVLAGGPNPESRVPAAEHAPPEFKHVPAASQDALDQHINDGGLCAVCGCAWPCERAETGRALRISAEKEAANGEDL
jgi:hypothetical protein